MSQAHCDGQRACTSDAHAEATTIDVHDIEDHELPAVKPNAAAGHGETADGRDHPVLNIQSDMPWRHIEHDRIAVNAVALAIDLAQQVAEMGTNVLAGDTNVAGVGAVLQPRRAYFGGWKMAERSKLALLVFFSIVSVLFWAAVIEYLVARFNQFERI